MAERAVRTASARRWRPLMQVRSQSKVRRPAEYRWRFSGKMRSEMVNPQQNKSRQGTGGEASNKDANQQGEGCRAMRRTDKTVPGIPRTNHQKVNHLSHPRWQHPGFEPQGLCQSMLMSYISYLKIQCFDICKHLFL